MDLVSVGEKLLSWLLTRRAARSTEIDSYIRQVQTACRELVEIEDPDSDKACLLHEQLKVLYDAASAKLPHQFINAEGWNLYRALSSARIYYWLRRTETKHGKELQESILERRRMSPSFDVLSDMLLGTADRKNLAVDTRKLDFQRVRELCLHDIANLSRLRPFPW